MLQLLKKLLNWLLPVRHGEAGKESPIASSPRVSGFSANGPFSADLIAAARSAADDYGPYIWPSVTLAQWALESAYGKSMPPGTNNPFGIKAIAGQPAVWAKTWEVINGKRYNISQPFRKFASLDAAFSAHNKLLATSKHYRKARAAQNAEQFMEALTGIYATDPKYDQKLKAIARKYNLYQYDG